VYFGTIACAYLASGKGVAGVVGAAESYRLAAPDLVEFAVRWLESTFGEDCYTEFRRETAEEHRDYVDDASLKPGITSVYL
jgi:hypothetical protein